MAIHHDSHAYGNLKKLSGEMNEEQLLAMLQQLNAEEPEKPEGQKEGENPDKRQEGQSD